MTDDNRKLKANSTVFTLFIFLIHTYIGLLVYYLLGMLESVLGALQPKPPLRLLRIC